MTHLAFFFFNDTTTSEIYTLSLHDALPIFVQLNTSTNVFSGGPVTVAGQVSPVNNMSAGVFIVGGVDRKSTRLNSSHANISYAVCGWSERATNLWDDERDSDCRCCGSSEIQ